MRKFDYVIGFKFIVVESNKVTKSRENSLRSSVYVKTIEQNKKAPERGLSFV